MVCDQVKMEGRVVGSRWRRRRRRRRGRSPPAAGTTLRGRKTTRRRCANDHGGKSHFDEGRYKRSEDNVQAMVWLFAPIRKSLKCLLVIVIIFGFVSDCFLNLCFLQVDILQKLFPQKSKVGDSTQISDQYGTITCYTFLPHNNFLIQNTFLIHTKSWNRTFFFCYATGTGRKDRKIVAKEMVKAECW